MLISWIVLAIGQLSAAALSIVELTNDASGPTSAPATPGEPSTLIEGLIGVALIAAYLTFARRVRGRRSMQSLLKPTRAGSGRKAA
jgi:hypothetical protein